MTQEEKAKAYDKAIERAKDFMNGEVHYALREGENIMCWIFPELRESDDERIRKAIITLLNTSIKGKKVYSIADITRSEMIAWLEKQVEKPALSEEDKKIKEEIINYFECQSRDEPTRKDIHNKWIAWLKRQGNSSDQIHYWTEEEIEPIISDYLRGAEHYGGMIGRLRCLKPKSIEKQDKQKPTANNDMKEALRTEYEKGRADAIVEMQKPTQEIEPFEAEHGKYYYCIKDYFCGGKKQVSKGDVIQALRGLPIMGLKDASEYFLPVNSIKRNSAWSEEDELSLKQAIYVCHQNGYTAVENWLKSLKQRIGG